MSPKPTDPGIDPEWRERALKTSRIHVSEWLMEWIETGDLPGWSREGNVLSMEYDGRRVCWKLTGKRNEHGGLEAVWPD